MANILPRQKQVAVLNALVEGVSVRSTERMLDVSRETVLSLLVRVGEGCAALHNRMMRNLQCQRVECDEIWAFVQKKQTPIAGFLVAHRAAQLAAVVGDDAYVRMVTQWASVHDGPEAYILDMSRPVKVLPEMAPYRAAEKAIMQALCIRLGLPEVMPPEVKQADMELCYTEARDLLGPKHPAWCWGALPLAEEIVPQSPRLARLSWQSLFETLFPEHAPTSWLRAPQAAR